MISLSYSLPTYQKACEADVALNGEISSVSKEWPYSLQEVCLLYLMAGKSGIEKCLKKAVATNNFLSGYIEAQIIQQENFNRNMKELKKLCDAQNKSKRV